MKKSMEPLHILYSYGGNEVDVTNSLQRAFRGLTAEAKVYDLDGSMKWSKKVNVDVEADSVWRGIVVPAVDGLSATYFLRLQLSDAGGIIRSINWYWLSSKGDVLDWSKSKWFVTPESSDADYTALGTLGKTTLVVAAPAGLKEEDSTVHAVTITNTGKVVAFQVHLRALKGKTGDDILPVIFSDNYLELAPGEARTIWCKYADRDAGGSTPFFLVSAWNLDATTSRLTGNTGFDDQK
jgi:exo-1,4-beta-D-glucosaminidase